MHSSQLKLDSFRVSQELGIMSSWKTTDHGLRIHEIHFSSTHESRWVLRKKLQFALDRSTYIYHEEDESALAVLIKLCVQQMQFQHVVWAAAKSYAFLLVDLLWRDNFPSSVMSFIWRWQVSRKQFIHWSDSLFSWRNEKPQESVKRLKSKLFVDNFQLDPQSWWSLTWILYSVFFPLENVKIMWRYIYCYFCGIFLVGDLHLLWAADRCG